jgi:hypothetical protein
MTANHRLEISPIPDRPDSVKFTDQLQQPMLGPCRIGCGSANPARQPIGLRLLLLKGELLWCRPLM